MGYGELKRWLLQNGFSSHQVDACYDKNSLLRLWETAQPQQPPSTTQVVASCSRSAEYSSAAFTAHVCCTNDIGSAQLTPWFTLSQSANPVRQLFDAIDRDSDGFITRDEFHKAITGKRKEELRSLGQHQEAKRLSGFILGGRLWKDVFIQVYSAAAACPIYICLSA